MLSKKRLFSLTRDCLLIGLILFAANYWQTRNLLATGQSFPKLTLPTLNGEIKDLIVPGKTNLIYVFAPWCGVCKLSISNAQALKDSDSSKATNIVLLAQSYSSLQEINTFINERELNIPVFLGTSASSAALNISAFPTYYLVDQGGQIIFRSVGYSSEWGMKISNWLGKNS